MCLLSNKYVEFLSFSLAWLSYLNFCSRTLVINCISFVIEYRDVKIIGTHFANLDLNCAFVILQAKGKILINESELVSKLAA